MKKQITIKPNKSLNNKQIIYFLIFTGLIIFFIGIRFSILGAWPILIFGLIEFGILTTCTFLYYNYTKNKQTLTLNKNEIQIQKIFDQEIVDNQKYNLHWSQIKNNQDSLSLHYAGKKNIFANFLSGKKRLKLKKIIERYKSRYI
jgi:uncharacterized membrane protein